MGERERNMKIYFAASMLHGQQYFQQHQLIADELRKYGTILDEQVIDETISPHGEIDLTNREIFEREMKRIEECDIMIAEVSSPSRGVGYDIATGVGFKKRVVALYYGKYTDKLTAMIDGNPGVEVYTYQEDNLPELIKKVFTK